MSDILISVRITLAFLVCSAFTFLTASLKRLFGSTFAIWFTLISVSQFHFNFYLSRTLPNVFALIFVLFSISFWLRKKDFLFILNAAVAVIIFRGEVALLMGPFLLMNLTFGKRGLVKTLGLCLLALVMTLPLTVAIDSWFWKRLLWPEGEVLYFNVILNKSSEWGVSPWPWYFYSAIPRALFTSTALIPLGLWFEVRVARLVYPALLFIFLFSFLPHKELRFIIYALPLLNIAAAAMAQRIWQNRSKSWLFKVMTLAVVGHVCANAAFSVTMAFVSSHNYPGGVAMEFFHQHKPEGGQKSVVHVDNLACQTGVSRFNQAVDWQFDKTEHLTLEDKLDKFDFLIQEAKEDLLHSTPLKSFQLRQEVMAFSGFKVDYQKLPPIVITQKPALWILEKKST